MDLSYPTSTWNKIKWDTPHCLPRSLPLLEADSHGFGLPFFQLAGYRMEKSGLDHNTHSQPAVLANTVAWLTETLRRVVADHLVIETRRGLAWDVAQ